MPLTLHRQVTLDQYATMVFGRKGGKLDAWICAEPELKDALAKGEDCQRVMHKGDLVWACIMDQSPKSGSNSWQRVDVGPVTRDAAPAAESST